MDTVLKAVGSIAVFSYLVPLILFIIVYARGNAWHSTYIGRTLMLEKASFTLVIFIVIATNFFPFPGMQWVRAIFFVLTAVLLWLDFFNLRRVQHEGHPVIFHRPDGTDTHKLPRL